MAHIQFNIITIAKLFQEIIGIDIQVTNTNIEQLYGKVDRLYCDHQTFKVDASFVNLRPEIQEFRLFIDVKKDDGKIFIDYILKHSVKQFSFNTKASKGVTLPENMSKIVFFLEKVSLLDSLPVFDLIVTKNIKCHLIMTKTSLPEDAFYYIQAKLRDKISLKRSLTAYQINDILRQQQIGTIVFIFGSWAFIDRVKAAAMEQGFSTNEMFYEGNGKKLDTVFCVKCYRKMKLHNSEQTCVHCHTKLVVSNHFSKRLDAYLGYIDL
ncbi:dimethylamine monooxygenase subunit DmmA family protein [Alkalihalobacillus sp. BA299]|uniref:dimethylamine monooxygenase subunit DmmA family protein n=1 Tax=Alkalihalobacillus sp. BA299 TaxID=2815938 RepID=UPI001AD989A5|nr:dimethylamine monooxygenase subunit DmmA family protein [Alkalihalobacillus sp. BA299]